MLEQISSLQSNRSDLIEMKITARDSTALDDGDVRLRLDLFSLTTNNITYAGFGDSIGYWRSFPTQEHKWGHMPVWGFADVTESRADGVSVGQRVWGFFPMTHEITVRAGDVTKFSFVDKNIARNEIPAVYARYNFCDTNPFYTKETEAISTIYRPLFITAFTAAEFLQHQSLFGAKRIIITSASSKTAYSLAWCLRDLGIELVGLTSPRNVSFVESLKCYNNVQPYQDVEKLPVNAETLYVDFSGKDGLRDRIHKHLGKTLVYDCLVGSTQTDAFPDEKTATGIKPKFFFAADVLDRHREEKTLGRFLDRFEEDQLAFFTHAASVDHPWISISEGSGLSAARDVVTDLLNGGSDPSKGHVIRL